MRISDWSSDVCSSDLLWASGPLQSSLVIARCCRSSTPCRFRSAHAKWSNSVACTPCDRPRRKSAPLPVKRSPPAAPAHRSEEHTSELQSLMRISYAVFCLKKKKAQDQQHT